MGIVILGLFYIQKMSFNDISQKAETWARSENFDIQTSETERKIVFKHKTNDNVSFYVICPENSSVGWHVWSDSEDVLMQLNDAIQSLGSCEEKTINEVLQLVSKKLQSLLGAAKEGESDASSGVGDCSDEDYDDEDESAIDDMYYHDEDADALQDITTKLPDNEETEDDKYFSGDGSPAAVGRLVKDMKSLKKSNGQFGVTGVPRGDNLFVWDVQLTDFDKKSLLGKDLLDYAKKYKREPVIYMELKFPRDYPMCPPFARVIRPRFRFLTGHITIGGSVCMEMLTKSGWRPINDIESILVQIRSEVMSDPNARLDSSNPDREYDETEAKQAFERTVQRYGWNS